MSSEAHALADALGNALSRRDPQILQAIYADDISVWHAATGGTMGKAQNIGLLSQLFSVTSRLKYVDIRRYDIENGLIQQHTLTGAFDHGGELPALSACLIIKVANGKIARIEEYFDSQTFADVWARLATLSTK